MKKVYHSLSTTSYRFLMSFAAVVIDFLLQQACLLVVSLC